MNTRLLKIKIPEPDSESKISTITESICGVNISENMYSNNDFLYKSDDVYIEECIENDSPRFKTVISEFMEKYIDDILLENQISVTDGKYQIEIRKSHDTKNYLFCIESNDSKFYFEVKCDRIKKLMGH